MARHRGLQCGADPQVSREAIGSFLEDKETASCEVFLPYVGL